MMKFTQIPAILSDNFKFFLRRIIEMDNNQFEGNFKKIIINRYTQGNHRYSILFFVSDFY